MFLFIWFSYQVLEYPNQQAFRETGEPLNIPYEPIGKTGTFTWVAPDGTVICTDYTADENGYHPRPCKYKID